MEGHLIESAGLTDQTTLHQEGVEPPTYGSEDRCSIH